MINRVGTFFILLGIMLIGLFVLSDLAKTPSCGFLIFGGISLAGGIAMWLRDPVKPGPPSGRFRILKGGNKKQPQKK